MTPPGLGALRNDGPAVPDGRDCRDLGRGKRRSANCRTGGRPTCQRPAKRRQHGGQGDPLRDRQFGPLGDRHHGYLMRRRQRDARQLYAAGRPDSACEYADWRDHLRRRRVGPVRDAGDGGARRLHRGPDGRPHA